MNRKVFSLLAAFVLWAVIGGVRTVGSSEPERESKANQTECLDVQYARAYLELAETDLQIALDANHNVPGTYPGAAVAPLRQVVELAKAERKSSMYFGRKPKVCTKSISVSLNWR